MKKWYLFGMGMLLCSLAACGNRSVIARMYYDRPVVSGNSEAQRKSMRFLNRKKKAGLLGKGKIACVQKKRILNGN